MHDLAVVVVAGEQVGQTQTRTGNGTVVQGQTGAGEYVVSVNYQTPAEGVSAQSAAVVTMYMATIFTSCIPHSSKWW